MLTAEKLKAIPKNTIFAIGDGLYPSIHDKPICWLAIRGEIPDWTIYYHLIHQSLDYVRHHGNKMFGEDNIKLLVPCDDMAFKFYRY